jgi:hypothetical protein
MWDVTNYEWVMIWNGTYMACVQVLSLYYPGKLRNQKFFQMARLPAEVRNEYVRSVSPAKA